MRNIKFFISKLYTCTVNEHICSINAEIKGVSFLLEVFGLSIVQYTKFKIEDILDKTILQMNQ